MLPIKHVMERSPLRVRTVTVPNASPWPVPSGVGGPAIGTSRLSLFSCRVYCARPDRRHCLAKQANCLRAFSSEPLPTHSGPLQPTPNTSEHKLVSLPFFTPGDKICYTIRICIASFPAADSPSTAHNGWGAARVSSCPCACYLVFSGAYF